MPISFTLQNPGLVTAFQVDPLAGTSFESYGIETGAGGLLQTREYAEGGPEMWQLQPDRKPVPWGVPVPDGALVFGAASAMSPEIVKQFWVGWVVRSSVRMQALMQEKPVEQALERDETPVFPALMDGDGRAALYTWRPVGAATALWRHVFTGKIKEAPSVATEALSEVPGRPATSVAGFIPGERAAHAVIGWIEATPAGSVLGIAVVLPERMTLLRSDPIAGTVPFPNQRLAVWAKAPRAEGQFQLVGVVQSTGSPPTYQLAELNVRLSPRSASVTLKESGLPAGQLHAAAFEYEKNQIVPAWFPALLAADGTLFTGPHDALPHRVPLDSALPLATGIHRYVGTRQPDGTLTFEGI